jgi:biofilm protein TabA
MMRSDPGPCKNLEFGARWSLAAFPHAAYFRGAPSSRATADMILDSLTRASSYRGLGPRLAAGFDYLTGFDPATPTGRHFIDGEDLFAVVDEYDTGPATEKRFESHLRYVDIQYVVSGRERILHAPADTLHVETPYDEERDIAFYQDPPASSSFLLLPGHFAIFFPADGHKPGCMAGGRDAVRKVVLKVRVPG